MDFLKKPNTVKYWSIFFMVVLLLPLFEVAFFAETAPLEKKLDFVFHTQKIFLIIAVSMIAFFLIKQDVFVWKSSFSPLFLILGLGVLLITLSTQIPFFTALQSGLIEVDQSMRYDLLGTTIPLGETSIRPGIIVSRTVHVDKQLLPENVRIGLHGYATRSETSHTLHINEHMVDITSIINDKPLHSVMLYETYVDSALFTEGENIISIESTGGLYAMKNHYYVSDSQIITPAGKKNDDGMVLLFADTATRPGLAQSVLFMLRPLFIMMGFVLVFIGFFGLTFCKKLFAKAKLELISAMVISIGFFLFLSLLEVHWKTIALGAIAISSFLLGIFYDGVLITFGRCPAIGIENSMFTICRSSSGYESAALFAMLSLIILITSWKAVRKTQFLIFFILGLLGTILVNGIRIFSILAVGIIHSEEFAQGVFHTNIGWILFLLYALLFWLIVLPYVKNK